jgi:hypothetical protein
LHAATEQALEFLLVLGGDLDAQGWTAIRWYGPNQLYSKNGLLESF